MENGSHSETVVQNSLSTLCVEVLVHIVSFLPTREKIRIRYVSKTLRSISEVPSLWEDFIWSHYAPRDEKILKHVLKIVGKCIKRIHFSDHIAPSKLEAMLKSCKNVLHLSLPSFQYGGFEKLIKIVHSMVNIQIMHIRMPGNADKKCVQQYFSLFSNCKEVSLHCEFTGLQSLRWLAFEEWANLNYMPRTLNIVATQFPTVRTLASYLHASSIPMLRKKSLQKILDIDQSACFSIYLNKTSTDFLEAIPYIQLKITGSSVVLSSVKASKYGILGLDHDILHLTQGIHRGKQIWKALLTKAKLANIDYIDTSVISLTSITYFDASRHGGLYPGHLEQLSIACPNLQTLDLSFNSDCLGNLQGLQSLANNCKGLLGLSLKGVHILNCEYSCIELWEILCTLNLTQLAIESCMIKISDGSNAKPSSVVSLAGESSKAVMQQKLNQMAQRYSSLKILEVGEEAKYMHPFMQPCYNISDNELSVITSFPSITCYRLCNLPSNNCYHTLKQIFSQRYLKRLFLCKTSLGILSLSIEGHCPSLQELCIHSAETVPTETFIDALCGHVGLECVTFHVKSLSARSIENMIERLSNLVTFHIFLYSRAFLKSHLKQLKSAITTKFSNRRLFNGGNFDVQVFCRVPSKNSIEYNRDLLSVWDSLT